MREVWIFAHPGADRFVDVTDTIDAKIAALRAHASQTAAMDLDTFIRGWASATAADGGLADGRLAEGFLTCRTG